MASVVERDRTLAAAILWPGRLTARPPQRHPLAMHAKKKRTRRKPSGQLIDVARVVSVGQDREESGGRPSAGQCLVGRREDCTLGVLA